MIVFRRTCVYNNVMFVMIGDEERGEALTTRTTTSIHVVLSFYRKDPFSYTLLC